MVNRQFMQDSWNDWAVEHQDPLSSVGRVSDMEQTKRIAKDVAGKLELGPEDDLLDVGCGSGLLLSLLRPKCRSAVGVDFSSAQVMLGRRCFPELTFIVGAADELDNLHDGTVEHVLRKPFQDGRFSRLLCYSVWHYVDNWRETLDGFLRVLSRPGIMLIGDIPGKHHRSRLYVNYLRLLPTLLLHPGRFIDKLSNLLKATPWHWVDLGQMAAYLENRGCYVEVLEQPRGHRQHGSLTDTYRFDLKVRIPPWPLRPAPNRKQKNVAIPQPMDCGMKPVWR